MEFKPGDMVRVVGYGGGWRPMEALEIGSVHEVNALGLLAGTNWVAGLYHRVELVAPRLNVTPAATEVEQPSPLETAKPSNPKDLVGSGKLPLHLVPSALTAAASVAFLNGALKYGRSNWRVAGVRASIYADAAYRHLAAWFEGEEVDPDDGVPHLSAVLACVGIILDARAAGKLNDDRCVAGGYRALSDGLTAHVARLKALHAGKSPKHYTIEDSSP